MSKSVITFWVAAAAVTAGIVMVLQYLGPPVQLSTPITVTRPKTAEPAPAVSGAIQATGTGGALQPGMPILAPIAGLMGPSVTNQNWLVPQVGPGGLTSMRAYAGANPVAGNPRVAIMVAGLGNDDGQSQEAIYILPAAISFAISPYGQHIDGIAALARASGHEIFLALPMQEQDPVTENAGNEALVMSGPITTNQPMLDWNLSRLQGYVGVTDAMGLTQGAGFMDNPDAKSWLLQELSDKGLCFIDARQTGFAPYAWNRTADVVIDPINAPQNAAAQLADLAADAKLRGSALGILLAPAPAALKLLQNWTESLPGQSITLAPVTALVSAPVGQSSSTASQ